MINSFCFPFNSKYVWILSLTGKRGVFTIDEHDPAKVIMKEMSCPPDRYQRDSSDCINACKGSRTNFSNLPDSFVVYSNGSSTQPPEVYCNYTAGYYNFENITLFDFDEAFLYLYGSYCIHVSVSDPCVKGHFPLPSKILFCF